MTRQDETTTATPTDDAKVRALADVLAAVVELGEADRGDVLRAAIVFYGVREAAQP